MSRLSRQLEGDRALRDAALALVKTDLALLRADLGERGLGARLTDRLSDGTMDILDDTLDYAEDNKGKVAAMIAAIVLWFARGPIFRALGRLFDDPSGDWETEGADDRSSDN